MKLQSRAYVDSKGEEKEAFSITLPYELVIRKGWKKGDEISAFDIEDGIKLVKAY